ncbi:hypothetical protein BDN71DRAFT_1460290 [Pleurotus eryngii]|uniref:F-box domain-containing protein n=1 Tax=Pleurotus eryngii TaxID=5323 RepID=A0A9P6A917_PLEER|nr:hypothetical protein BDN71DRAFT_1460290 [Pleurotus eryngii]
MSLYTTSSVQRALAIPELLSSICQLLGPKDILTNACVCKKWSNVALDVLWKEVDDIHNLLSLLAPLEQKAGQGYKFSRSIEPEDWKRFTRYAGRIRALVHNRERSKTRTCTPNVFHEVSRTRISLDILPVLHTLEWSRNIDLNFCVLFMHKTVKRFKFYLREEMVTPPNGLGAFFQAVMTRMPDLEVLDISSVLSVSDIEADMIKLLSGLPKLKEVILPLYYVSPSISGTLSQLPNLNVLGFQYDDEQGRGDSQDVAAPPATLGEGAFPVLYDLALSMPFIHASELFDQPFSPQNITMLFIDSALPESPSDIHNLLSVIVKNCPLLINLSLNPHLSTTDNPPTDERLTYANMRPVLTLPNLTSFDINHYYPIDLKYKDMEELARAWPNLETLMLNSDPVALDHPPALSIAALIPFAEHCPNIRQLGLYMNAAEEDLPSSRDLVPFKCLETLSVGLSHITDHENVALFLSHLIPSECELECGGTWRILDWESSSPASEYGIIHQAWSMVGSVLPLLHKVRMQERKRYEEAKSELNTSPSPKDDPSPISQTPISISDAVPTP